MTDLDKKYKYNCEKCKFYCNAESTWLIHTNTSKHKTGKNKQRCDLKEPYKCEKCNYETKNKITLEKHILNEHGSREEREKRFKFYCNMCDFGTFSIDTFNIHEESNKHKKRMINYK